MIDYLELDRAIKGAYYAGEFRWLRKLTGGVLPLQDNDPAHTSQVAMTAETNCGFEMLPHPQFNYASF